MGAYPVGLYEQHSVTIAAPVFAYADIKHTPTSTCAYIGNHIAFAEVTVGVMQAGRADPPVL